MQTTNYRDYAAAKIHGIVVTNSLLQDLPASVLFNTDDVLPVEKHQMDDFVYRDMIPQKVDYGNIQSLL